MIRSIITILIFLAPLSVSAMDMDKTVQLINQAREQYGVESVQIDETLNLVAAAKAKDMVENDYWAHNNDGDTWKFFRLSGYQYAHAGENLAQNFSDEGQMVAAWLNSPVHKAVMLDRRYTETGIAEYGNVVVSVFARPGEAVKAVAIRQLTPKELEAKQCLP